MNFLALSDLDDDHLRRLLGRARDLEEHPVSDALRGKVMGLIFLNPSLRTLTSFQAGMAQLGGSSVVLTPGQGTWGLETRTGVVMDQDKAEHVREAVPVLNQYTDGLGLRCFAAGEDLAEDVSEPVLSAVAGASRKPLVNMESAVDHPCQALGDWKTLDDLEVPEDGKLVLSWAWHPRPLPLAVPSAVAKMTARRGMKLTVLRPEGFALPDEVLPEGVEVEQTSDRAAAMDGAVALYAKSWRATAPYGDPDADAELRRDLRDWCVAEDWFEPAAKAAPFLHCLPVRRNVVVREELLESPRSVVVQQAGNRLHAQKAVLMELLGGA
jgi:N-acetylornithine carbamoyltransferase